LQGLKQIVIKTSLHITLLKKGKVGLFEFSQPIRFQLISLIIGLVRKEVSSKEVVSGLLKADRCFREQT